MKDKHDSPKVTTSNPFLMQNQSSIKHQHQLSMNPSMKSKISINNINVNANNLNVNTNALLISKKENDSIKLSMFSKPFQYTKNDPQLLKVMNNNNNSKAQFNKTMISNLRHQFNEIANKTMNNKAENISIIESYSKGKYNLPQMKSTKCFKKNSLNGSFNNVIRITANPTPTEYNYCETEDLTLDSVEECEREYMRSNAISPSHQIMTHIGQIRPIDIKAQSLKAIVKEKANSVSKEKVKEKAKGNEELQKKYNHLVHKYNRVIRDNKELQEENTDLKKCISIMKASHHIIQKQLSDKFQSAINRDYLYYINKANKEKDVSDFFLKQNNQLKKLILVMYNNILLYSNDLLSSDKQTEVIISQLVNENKMLRHLLIDLNRIPNQQIITSKEQGNRKKDKRRSHWEDEAKHNRSETTIHLTEKNKALNTTSIHNMSVDKGTSSNSNNNNNNSILSQSQSNLSYSGHFGNSNLYLKNNIKRELMENIAFVTSHPVKSSLKKSVIKLAYNNTNKRSKGD